MAERDLADREHANLIAAYSAAARNAPDHRVERDRGIALFAVAMPFHLFNQVLVEHDDADPAALADAVTVMRERGARFLVNLREGIDDAWIPRVEALGLVPSGPEPWMPGMAAYPLPSAGSAPVLDGHEIRRVADADGIRDHRAAAAAGFGLPDRWIEWILGEATLADPAAAVYVGYTDEQAVTSGLGHRTGDTIGVYNIATIESARRRGYGAAMTMRIVEDGAAAGCDVAVLQASDMGHRVYERLGFRTVVRYRGWVEPAAGDPPTRSA